MDDPHLDARNMLVRMPRTDGVTDPVVVPGNPVKMTGMADGPDTMPPMLGQHTDSVLTTELGMNANDIAQLRSAGVIR